MTLPRLLLLAAIAAGVSYLAGWGLHLPAPAAIAWKGAGVGLLALYAASKAKSLDGWILAAVMAFGCAGDVLLETHGLTVGALAFLAGHLVAIWLYLRNRQAKFTARQLLLAGLLIPATVATAWSLPFDRAAAPGIGLYAFGLSVMAASAYLSRFRQDRVALGALMFLVSDQLIFARAGPLHGVAWVSDAVWILYFGGQTLIAMGVTEELEEP
ncbi:MAG TPA: lysoplasmalogenase family protein [Phenylobacterium sp.]